MPQFYLPSLGFQKKTAARGFTHVSPSRMNANLPVGVPITPLPIPLHGISFWMTLTSFQDMAYLITPARKSVWWFQQCCDSIPTSRHKNVFHLGRSQRLVGALVPEEVFTSIQELAIIVADSQIAPRMGQPPLLRRGRRAIRTWSVGWNKDSREL